ncbi:hypothetical protein TRFO_08346 [Tritrichomonas foetus]|uniref:Uncharacterized protein n=1 Tax=Tritrichomonas foetus TaxID=1144522 RepID=A0A1J4JMN1_9EUKA|nr:hypothetical protein TRFO_08346 [Tritrichomonas foetus]|eukprot:OHS99695.1 hypothetical protein TRFO_08346 [Tritrichomonas foetus]
MESLLTQLKALPSSPNAQVALHKMQELLLSFDSLLPEKASDSEILSIEAVLLSLLKINNGIIAPYCAICIGSHLAPLYKLEKSHRFWNLISAVTDSPTPANIFAVGYVIKKIGHDSRSSLSNLAQNLTSVKEPLVYPALYTLRSLYKVCGDILSKFATNAFHFAKGYISSQHEPTHLAAVQLLQVLVPFSSIPQKKILSASESSFKYCHSSFALDECSHLAALCAVVPYIKKSKGSNEQAPQGEQDFVVKTKAKKESVSELANSLNVLKRFKNNFSNIFPRFLDLLEPEFVFKNAKELINFALTTSPIDHAKVTAFFARDIRSEVLKTLLQTPNTPFSLLRTLTYDSESAKTVAEIAEKKIWGSEPQEKYSSGLYFIALTNSYPEQATECFSSSINYLLNPPENADMREYDGKSLITSLIISTIDNKQRLIETNREALTNILKSLTDNQKIIGVQLQDYFMILSTLPDNFVNIEFVNQQLQILLDKIKKMMHTDEKNRKIPSRLIEFCILFLSTHPNIQSTSQFIESVFQLASSLSNVALLGLIQLLTKIQTNETLLTSAAFFYLSKLLTMSFPLPYIKKRCPGLMRQPEDFYLKQKAPPVGRSPLFFVEESVLSTKLCDLLPVLFSQLSESSVTKFLNTLIKNGSKITSVMIILALYQNENSKKRIPETFIDQLLKISNPDNNIRCQIVCDAIAIHAATHLKTVKNIMTFLQKCKPTTACFISASVAKYTKLPDKEIINLLKSAEQKLKDPQTVNYALHYIGTLYEAKSVELVTLCDGDQQLQIFFNLLNSSTALTTHTMSMISFCIERLLPVLLPFLHNESTQAMMRMIMNAFSQSPVHFSKQFFHYIYRQVIAFSPDVALKIHIKYPESNQTPIELKLATCGSLADLSKVQKLPDLFDLIPQLMVLLQRTKDERVDKFIVAIAKSFDEQNFSPEKMTQYFRLAKKILSSNAAPGFGEATVEPNTFVKSSALHIIQALLPMLASRKPLLTECLDDLMTSTIRAIETTKIELHAIAYPILNMVIEKFRYTKDTEGQHRLLELYESQFSIATRFAFPASVDVSSNFLVSYLDFYFDEYLNNQQSFLMLLDGYVNGLQHVLDKTNGFFSVSSRLCILARDSSAICDHFISFLSTLTPIFSQLVLDSIKLRSTKADWEDVSKYRATISPFYHNLLPSFVWLHKTFPTQNNVIDVNTMVSFFLLEMTISSESWRINAAFAAIISIFNYYPDKIAIQMLSLIMFACVDVVKKNSQLLGPLIPQFLLYASRMLQKTEVYSDIWNCLCNILFKGTCDAEALGLLIKNAQHDGLSVKFAGFIVSQVKSKHFSEDEGIALMTILYETAPAAIPAIVKRICSTKMSESIKFKMQSLRRALIRSGTRESFDKAAFFVVKHFEQGGMEFASQILVRNPTLGVELLARGAANAAVVAIDESIDKAIECIRFLQLAVSCLKSEPTFAVEAIKASIHAIAKWAGDRKRGKEVVSESSILVQQADKIDPSSSKKAYDEVTEEDKSGAIKAMQKFAQTERKKSTKLSLKKFSVNVRKQNDGGDWQSLDIDD